MLETRSPQLTTNTVVMVPPQCFAFNTETGKDNEFQHPSKMSQNELKTQAMLEFNNMVSVLQKHGINVLVLDAPQDNTPDAVFPNNWFSTDINGNLYLYPMSSDNRKKEVCPESLVKLFSDHHYAVNNVIDVRELAMENACLEGTGAMVIDHCNNTVFAAISQRCNSLLLEQSVQRMQAGDVFAFETELPSGSPVYHTNVMLSVGEKYAIICSSVISSAHKEKVLGSLKGKQLIDISLEQLAAFCGNVLQLHNKNGDPCLVMSKTAFEAFTNEQKTILAEYGELIQFDVRTIEAVGGGSVRCMLAEVFLPISI